MIGMRIFGLHAARTALEHVPEQTRRAWLNRSPDRKLLALRERLEALDIPVETTDRKRLDRLADSSHHQGIVLEVVLPPEKGERELEERLSATEKPLFLVLDQVQDPHNLGACLRTADATGVTGVIVPKDRTVGLTPTVYKVACGGAETVPIYRVTNLTRTLRRLKEAGVWIAGAAGEAEEVAFEADLKGSLALVLGAEGRGLRRLTRQCCDFLVKLPMAGSVESLNLSVAAGVLLYEVLRQREMKNSDLECV
ncbi:MAG: 23S rRNA (guanosine(2251)-2'-O)-methyltransferase RlmB [Methylohalobius crimeensis]